VQNVRKNAKSLLNPEMTVRYTAESVTQSEKIAVVKRDANRCKNCPVSNGKKNRQR